MVAPPCIALDPTITTLYIKRSDDASISISFGSGDGMDRSAPTQSHNSRSRRLVSRPSLQRLTSRSADQQRPSTPSAQRLAPPSPTLQHPHTAPLPQTQWVDPELSYESQQWTVSGAQPRLSSAYERSSNQTSSRDGPKRRRFRDLLLRPAHQSSSQREARQEPFDLSMLYPEMNPYSDRFSTISAPDSLEYYHARSISEAELGSFLSPSNLEDPAAMGVPRSPTYPPSGAGRMRSATGVTDAAFADEEEFRLFVQATVGLGPEQQPREQLTEPSSHLVPPPLFERSRTEPAFQSPPRHIPDTALVSPIEDTPTTRHAFQHLAQMPVSPLPAQSERLPMIDLDDWLSRSARAASSTGDVSPIEESFGFDDELPDYAESQAQAQAGQRAEAARRAQELQRRWIESGARRAM